ncbi:MAG: beta-ketoacyl-[acyl-carrier-protein] synthase family protein [Burkholderiaceae bacterium]|nr:MAG: beta-ketoacyl-[acyl-carrier-protein] synthase family protein [Burkholderiaceae bacterium]
MRRVVITGLGVISPIGNSKADFLEALRTARSGIKVRTPDYPDLKTRIAGFTDFNPTDFLTRPELTGMDRVSQFTLAAAKQAMADAQIAFEENEWPRVGVALGTGLGGANTINETYVQLFKKDPNRVHPLSVLMTMSNAPAAHIALKYQAQGPSMTYTCACSSSNIAIGEAARQIRHGYADVMFTGGTEAMLNYGSLKGWEAMRVLGLEDPEDPSRSCKPFSKNRTGLVLGEGAAVFILESLEHAQRRGAKIYAELVGYGSTNDPGHITRPSVEGQAQAMRAALQDAMLTPDAIDYINAHGTATAVNDATETAAIKQVFGERAYRLPVSSTKSMHGHLLGAAGAVEMMACLLALEEQMLPPTAGVIEPDPECDLDYVAGVARRGVAVRTVMSNSFAFGGSNAVLIVQKRP